MNYFKCTLKMLSAWILWSFGLTVISFGAQPNVVLVLADDLGYGDLGCYGGKDIPTPNLDSVAASGIRFTDGYVSSPVCGPSRAGLLTGAYQNRFGIQWNPDVAKNPLPESQMTLLETFRNSGYKVGVAGKWNLNADINRAADEQMDIMFWGGDYWPQEDGHYIGVDGIADGKVQGLWGPLKQGDEYLTDRLTRRSCNFIAENADKPFLLYLAYNAPHSPLHGKLDHAEAVSHLSSEPERLYASMVLAIDEGIGRINQALADHQLTENTIFIFISDNGPAKSGFKNYKEHWPELIMGSAGPLAGTKGTFQEGGIRVPFIMRWPNKLPSGTEFNLPVSSIDIYPTLCSAAGIIPAGSVVLDGMDIIPFLPGDSMDLNERALYWSSGKSGALRKGDWKLLLTEGSEPELFKLSADIAEMKNLAEKHPNRVKRYLNKYTDWIDSINQNENKK